MTFYMGFARVTILKCSLTLNTYLNLNDKSDLKHVVTLARKLGLRHVVAADDSAGCC